MDQSRILVVDDDRDLCDLLSDFLSEEGYDVSRAYGGKDAIDSAIPQQPETTMEVRGRHLLTGLPTAVELSSGEVRAAIQGPLGEVLQAVRDTLEETPPELASDVAKDGILLAGGGTLIRGFRELVADETGMPVFSAESPLTCVVFGSGQALDHLDKLARTSRNRRPSLTPDWRTS